MNPIEFECTQTIPAPADVIFDRIADTATWSAFRGYGILPGIRSAAYEMRAPAMVGSRIRVRNTDGSEHVEEIYKWEAGSAIAMRLLEFGAPLSSLAAQYSEEWRFEPRPSGTSVSRRIRMYPKSAFTRPMLWLISLLLKQAIARNLDEMAAMR